MNARPILFNFFDKKASELIAKFVVSTEQRASRNLGDNRENFINNFLKESLPPKLVVKSGEIWDKLGYKTGQIDTIIIRNDAPSLDCGGYNAYLAEGVFATIEIKSNLSIDKLKEAIETLKKVELLSISKPPVAIGGGPTLDRPLRIVFAYKGINFEKIVDFLNTNSVGDLLDLVCILEKGVLARRGRLLFPFDKITGEKMDKDIILGTKAASLGFLYYYLIQYGGSFSTGNIDLQSYFQPLENWGS